MSTIPQSIHNPAALTAADRAVRGNVNVDTNPDSDPTPTDRGFNTHEGDFLHVLAKAGDVTTTFDLELWLWDVAAGDWYMDTRIGTAGTLTVTQAGPAHPAGFIIETRGAPRVFVKLDNASGVWSGDPDKGASVWISHSSDGVY